MQILRSCRPLRFLAVLLFLFPLAALGQTRELGATGKDGDGARPEQAVLEAAMLSSNGPVKMRRREDLDELLRTLETKKPPRELHFYELRSAPRTALDASAVWVVVVAHSPGHVFELYSFEDGEGLSAAVQEFNRFTYPLPFSISKEQVVAFAGLFLSSCVGEQSTEIALDADSVRHAVERNYIAAYGNTHRALDAYVYWWEGFEAKTPALAPSVELRNGHYRVVVKAVATLEGRHPEIQEWDLEISRGGEVHVLGNQAVFPKKPHWLFFDFPTP